MKIGIRKLHKIINQVWDSVPYDARDAITDITMLDEENSDSVGNVVTIKLEYRGRNTNNDIVNKTLVVEMFPDGDNLPSRLIETSILEVK